MASISFGCRLMFIGLWNISDDSGTFLYEPAYIKGALFPFDDSVTPDTITEWLAALEELGRISKREKDGNCFGFVVNFNKHQVINRPSKWRYDQQPESEEEPEEQVHAGQPQWLQALQRFHSFKYESTYSKEIETEFTGLDLLAEARHFIDYYKDKGKLQRPRSAWRNWLRRATEWKERKEADAKKPILPSGSNWRP